MQQVLQELFINQYNSLHLGENSPRSAVERWWSRFPAQQERHIMRASIGSSIISRLAGAVAGLSLCGAGAAWAGDGADLGSLNALLADPTSGLCQFFKMSPCPQLPTVTQAVLQVAGLGNNVPEIVRAQNSIPPGVAVTAGNPAAVPPVD